MPTLQRLAEIFSTNFGPPFLKEGYVRVRPFPFGEEADRLAITIGRRTVEIGRDGDVVSSGTLMCADDEDGYQGEELANG